MLLQQVSCLLVDLVIGANLNVLQDLVASQSEEHLLGVLTPLQDDTDSSEGH